MEAKKYMFDNVSLLITNYNRSESLEKLLIAFHNIGCGFGETIVSDDGSKPHHIEKLNELKKKYGFELVTASKNMGLGNNINKGQDKVTKAYTVYIQEDFTPSKEFPEKFSEGLKTMEQDKTIDSVRFYSYLEYPYVKPYSDDFDLLDISPFGWDYRKIYAYSDHPHLRRSSFLDKFGRYPEGLKVEKTEYKMCISFFQNHGKGLIYKDFYNLLTQENSESEPSTVDRVNWRNKKNFFIDLTRYIFRQIKYNYDIHFMKSLES